MGGEEEEESPDPQPGPSQASTLAPPGESFIFAHPVTARRSFRPFYPEEGKKNTHILLRSICIGSFTEVNLPSGAPLEPVPEPSLSCTGVLQGLGDSFLDEPRETSVVMVTVMFTPKNWVLSTVHVIVMNTGDKIRAFIDVSHNIPSRG